MAAFHSRAPTPLPNDISRMDTWWSPNENSRDCSPPVAPWQAPMVASMHALMKGLIDTRCCSSRHPVRFETSFLELDGIL